MRVLHDRGGHATTRPLALQSRLDSDLRAAAFYRPHCVSCSPPCSRTFILSRGLPAPHCYCLLHCTGCQGRRGQGRVLLLHRRWVTYGGGFRSRGPPFAALLWAWAHASCCCNAPCSLFRAFSPARARALHPPQPPPQAATWTGALTRPPRPSRTRTSAREPDAVGCPPVQRYLRLAVVTQQLAAAHACRQLRELGPGLSLLLACRCPLALSGCVCHAAPRRIAKEAAWWGQRMRPLVRNSGVGFHCR